ncbi:hypothetical protein [Planctomycetes bacterium K23_9]|uniref:DUF3618 domain-containing protein n=1 Tax=Stieleria marina TaxID=1930275 RepID=A0A517NXW2_9BACT|nr:hypothetical protein K239x_39480 [Planctomycetes bacterium K23_9]
MATTLATEKQSEAIKQRMREIRTELPYSADQARIRVKQLTDWKYHLSRHPIPIVAATVFAGYLLAPSIRGSDQSPQRAHHAEQPAVRRRVKPAKKGILGGIVGTLATLAMKHAATIAADQVSNAISRREN